MNTLDCSCGMNMKGILNREKYVYYVERNIP